MKRFSERIELRLDLQFPNRLVVCPCWKSSFYPYIKVNDMFKKIPARYSRSVILFSLLFLLAGCQTTRKIDPPVAVPQDCDQKEAVEQLRSELHNQKVKVGELEHQLKEQKQLSGALQLKLLSRHAEIDKLASTNERLVRDFARNISKARGRGDKTETIRLIAEVDTVVISMAENTLSGDQQTSLLRAKKYLQEGKKELEKDNLEVASYLANQALSLTQDIQMKKGRQEGGDKETDVDFIIPLPMKLLNSSNVRKGPSLDDKVLFVLMEGAELFATGYRGQWVKVKIQGRGEGWVYYSLLGGI